MSGYCEPSDWKRLGDTPEEAFTVLAHKLENRIAQVDALYAENMRLLAIVKAADRLRQAFKVSDCGHEIEIKGDLIRAIAAYDAARNGEVG